MTTDGTEPPRADKSLSDIVGELTAKASLLVREEIELAKAEVGLKVSRLLRGAVAGAVGGIFALIGVLFLLHAVAWLVADLLGGAIWEIWVGFLITAALLFVVAGVAAFLALRFFRRGTPPTPELAIEEAKRTRAAIDEARS